MSTHAGGRTRVAAGGGARAAAPKESVQALHQQAARWQAAHPEAPREAQPGERATMLPQYVGPPAGQPRTADQQWAHDQISGKGPFPSINHWTPEQTLHNSLRLYGEHQLGELLNSSLVTNLRAMARSQGEPSGGAKADVLSRVVSHATAGHYSANFGGEKGGRQAVNAQPKSEAYYQKPTDLPTIESKLRPQNDPTDPAEAWQHFGATKRSVYEVLRTEPSGVLLAMLRHWNMPAGPAPTGKKTEYLARNIAERLEAHYNGRPMASRRSTSAGAKPAAPTKSPEQQHAERVAKATEAVRKARETEARALEVYKAHPTIYNRGTEWERAAIARKSVETRLATLQRQGPGPKPDTHAARYESRLAKMRQHLAALEAEYETYKRTKAKPGA